MRINTKILIGFLSIIIMVFTQMAITYKLQNGILENMRQIKDVESPLELMVKQVIGYDAILTDHAHSALLQAQKGEFEEFQEHKAKYDATGIKLDDLLKRDARILLGQSERTQETKDRVSDLLKELDRINLLLVDLETRAFAAMEKKDVDTAYSLIVGESYHQYKDELYSDYQAWAAIETDEVVSISNNILKKSQQIIYFNLIVTIILTVIMLIVLLTIRFFVAEKLYKVLYDSSKDALMTLNPPDWNFTSGNYSTLKMFNVKDKNEFSSLGPEDLSPQKQPDGQLSSVKAKKMIEKAMKEGSAFFDWTHKRYQGESFPATVLLSKIEEGGKTYLQTTVRDLTKPAERNLNK